MTNIYLNFLKRSSVILAIIIICAISRCGGVISDKRLCYDPNCSVRMSLARTLLRYPSPEPHILSFSNGQEVIVYSKSAGSRPDLWGVEINGKRGYVPKSMLREYKSFKASKTYEVPTEIVENKATSTGPLQQENKSKLDVPANEKSISSKTNTAKIEIPLENIANVNVENAKTNHVEAVPLVNIPNPEVIQPIQEPVEKILPNIKSTSPSYEFIDGTAIPSPVDDVPVTPSHATPILAPTITPYEQPILSIHPNLAPNVKPFLSTFSHVESPPSIPETLEPQANDFSENDTDESKLTEQSAVPQNNIVPEDNFEVRTDSPVPDIIGKNIVENDVTRIVENEIPKTVLNNDITKSNVENNESDPLVLSDSIVNNSPGVTDTKLGKPDFGAATEQTADPNEAKQNIELVANLDKIIGSPDTQQIIEPILNSDYKFESTDWLSNLEPWFKDDKASDGTDEQDEKSTDTLKIDNNTPQKLPNGEQNIEPVANFDKTIESPDTQNHIGSVTNFDNKFVTTDWFPNAEFSMKDAKTLDGTLAQNQQSTDMMKTDYSTPPESPDLKTIVDQSMNTPDGSQFGSGILDFSSTEKTVTLESNGIFVGDTVVVGQNIDNKEQNKELFVPTSTDNPVFRDIDTTKSQHTWNFNQPDEIAFQNIIADGMPSTSSTEFPPIVEMNSDQFEVPVKSFEKMYEEELKIARSLLNIEDSAESDNGHMNTDIPDSNESDNLATQYLQKDTTGNLVNQHLQEGTKDILAKQYSQEDITDNVTTQYWEEQITNNPVTKYVEVDTTDKPASKYLEEDTTDSHAANDFQEDIPVSHPPVEVPSANLELDTYDGGDGIPVEELHSNIRTEDTESISNAGSNDSLYSTNSMSTEQSQHQPTSDDICESNSDCPGATDADIPSAQEQETNKKNWDLPMVSLEGRDYWQTLLYLGVTAVTTLLFSLGYYYIENRTRDGELIARINKLEKELLVATKENILLDEGLKNTKNKLNSIEDESFGSNEMVSALKTELEECENAKRELEDQIVGLEKELETATEAGLELERMLREFLSSQSDENPLAQSVEDLQTRLNVQQATNESLTKTLNFKSQENETLSTELAVNQEKCQQLEAEVTRLAEELKTLTNSNTSQEKDLSEKIHLLTKQVTNISEERAALISELAVKKMELNDLSDVMKQQDTNNLDFDKLFEVSHIKAEAQLVTNERDEFKIKYQELDGAHQLLEEHMKLIQEEIASVTEQYELAEREKTEAQTRLEVLSNYFKEKESQLQKELGMQEALWVQKQGEVTSTVDRIQAMQNEIHSYRQQIETLKREILDQEREYKSQIAALETKTHEQWVIARQSERRLEESKAEASQLRNRLTLVEKSMNDVDPDSKLHRMETNGETAASPSLFMGGETSSSPILFTGSSGVPPLPPSYMYGNPLPPPFIPPPPHAAGGGAYDITRRPPPLGGRLSSPPPIPLHHLPSRYDDGSSPPPPLSPLHAPYNHCSPPPFSSDRIHPPPPPFLPPMGTSHSWGDETLPPLRNSVFHPQQREQRMRNHKGSLHSSGDSLDKSHQSGKV